MKMNWSQVLLIVLSMVYLSTCEKSAYYANNQELIENIRSISKEMRDIRFKVDETNSRISEVKFEINKFRLEMNTHNAKVQRKML